MNYTYRVSLSFMTYSDAQLVVFTLTILTNLAASLIFLTPSPTIAAMQLLYNNFVAALAAAANGGKTLTLHKNQARLNLLNGLRLLVLYIEANGNNDPYIMLGSGFLIHGGPNVSHPLAASPLILSVSDGPYHGSFYVKISNVDFALMYELRYTTDPFGPDARWNEVTPITSTTFLVEGLEPGTKIWIQVRSLNTPGRSEWSDPTYFMVR